ncbi:chemotaxis-specific protein-glutamate methyltransferase CheB [Actinotalea ferrariae]|uniref:chemotaxis-specific protein-glutamate methyltransferase CheB n=1 Tax=Actinotalea ferrariae TaxID=1386098 RepID=UPI001C8B64C9|nr:chemotaxis-specific protein-glutamate methyltransferase CheB [Actinotalea ferrariae]MBX9245151.1 chemotaxis-specific protein-glutamate methyltransferase CheB [Actinotalea ferrariae]
MARIRVLVVDDSVVVRRLVTDVLSADPAIEVVGIAANGQIALTKVEQLQPDLVTMDIEMPVMDGIEAVRALRRSGRRMPIIMFSTLTERGAVATLDALAAGASDYVAKPANVGSVQESLARVGSELVPRIKALVPRPGLGGPATAGAAGAAGTPASRATTSAGAAPARPAVTLRPRPESRRVRAVVLGSSTGGPEALSRLLGALPAALPVPVVVVQHMPPVFTRQLAARLDRLGRSTVVEAADGETLLPGTVYIAPGDQHLELVPAPSGARTRLHQGPPVNFCRPAVDVMMRSAVGVYGGDLLAVVLTGMGQDGRTGCEAVVAAGGTVVVQDEASSVVWGMPGAVATAGLAHAVQPVEEIAAMLVRATAGETHAVGGAR